MTDPGADKSAVQTPNAAFRHEVFDAEDQPKPEYARVLDSLPASRQTAMRALGEQMEATLREMGVYYGSGEAQAQTTSACDLLPHIFSATEWARVVAGVAQRLRAFEFFLQDVYGAREILRAGIVPIHLVLGSPNYHSVSIGLPRADDAFLHLSGLFLERDSQGRLAVKCHQLGRAGGVAYMIQNRRALARVLPASFEEQAVSSLADAPLAIGDALRGAAPPGVEDPSVVLLSSGPESPLHSEHTFLARRTGISLVQGGDLLVLDDHLYLKTVRGLKRVDVVYNRVADMWLDPLVLRKGSMLGVPGLVHCLRRGTVTLLNAIGAQLADDRALLCFAPKIIRFYLGEAPILPTVPTYWMGDIDQREWVLGNLADFKIEPVAAEGLALIHSLPPDHLAHAVRKDPGRYVAQPASSGSQTLYFADGKRRDGAADHLLFALRDGQRIEVFPGAWTRVFPDGTPERWISKDSWVFSDQPARPAEQKRPARLIEAAPPMRDVTSRVAEAFYWMGRYLERAYHQAYLIQVIETLETEELNSAERKAYRPMWNRLLPPLETSAGESRRSITTRRDRYRLTLLPKPGSVVSTFERAMANAESVQESLSPEAWATISSLRPLFQRARFKPEVAEDEGSRITLRLTAKVIQRIPQFFAIADRTMLRDDGWNFCEVGEKLERAIITAHAVASIGRELAGAAQPTEIQLSAFLRLLGTRDAYRRVFQMRAEPAPLLELLWQSPGASRSVRRCLEHCRDLLRASAAPDSAGAASALTAIDQLIERITAINWTEHLPPRLEEEATTSGAAVIPGTLPPLLSGLLSATLDLHQLISDGFLSHQSYIAGNVRPGLQQARDGV